MAEERALRDRLETFQLENQLRRADELEKVKVHFLSCFEDYVRDMSTSPGPLPAELENVRGELASTSEGIGFLLQLLKSVKAQLGTDRRLISESSALLRVIAGAGDAMNIRCWVDTLILRDPKFDSEKAESNAKDEPAKNNTEEKQLQSEDQEKQGEEDELSCDDTDLVQRGIAMHIKSVADTLSKRKEMLQKIEEAKIREQMSLIVLDPSGSDRYSRAETRLERGMHKALGALAILRASALLPALPLPDAANSTPIIDNNNVNPETGGVN